ncbi:MAG: hypothetical protein DRJ10_04670 [Bacteroidetes bacterium]|nr:MAG: hypothetical protein DRJ10_04670 [Bacteroidota bacterium]
MNIRKLGFLLIFASALFLYNCASTSKATVEKSENAKGFEKIADKGVVYLYRPGRAVGAAMQTQIKVNGKDAGGTGPGTFFKWELEAGHYVFSCFTPESSAAVELDIEPNKLYFLRQDTRLGVNAGRVTLIEVDESTGIEAIKKSKLLISSYK